MMGLEILASRGGNAPTSDTVGIKASERLLPSHFGWQERRGVTLLAQVRDPSHQEKIKLLTHNGSREEYIWPPCGPLGHLSVVLSPILTSCGQPEAERWNCFSKSFVFLNDVNGKKVVHTTLSSAPRSAPEQEAILSTNNFGSCFVQGCV